MVEVTSESRVVAVFDVEC